MGPVKNTLGLIVLASDKGSLKTPAGAGKLLGVNETPHAGSEAGTLCPGPASSATGAEPTYCLTRAR
ncbi:MAG: hypothetical protein DMG38_07200 [Acidobacteria bacterium]|nr:MAG: hypothetical protein DMG38_07200 [Acidobacteriota bacterium]